MSEGTLYQAVRAYIQREYEGVFSEVAMERHFRDYVELELSEGQFSTVRQIARLQPGQCLLDFGCGFGSFVFVCRRAGVEAIGVDLAEFQVQFARRRLTLELLESQSEKVYYQLDAQSTGLPSASYDIITAWNLMEHVPDYPQVLQEAHRLLKPGGFFFLTAPNYFAFRQEAHYHVPWVPLLPRPIARRYLRWLGRKTAFFDQHIHYVTNWGVLRALKRIGFRLIFPPLIKLERPEFVHSPGRRRLLTLAERLRLRWLVRLGLHLMIYNPLKKGIYLGAQKRDV